MFYKPSYCSNCGEKIERPKPSLTDSEKFCDVCKHDFLLNRSLPVIFVILMAMAGIWGLGSFWRSGEKPLNVFNKEFTANSSSINKNSANQMTQVNTNLKVQQLAQANNIQVNSQNAPQTRNLTAKPPTNTADSAPIPAGETVYYCGASTKKGTPCSRRVRGGGRCWQHQGQNAMLPPEKLIVSQ